MTGRIALEQFGSAWPEGEGLSGIAADIAHDAPDGDDAAHASDPGIDPEAEQAACLARISGALEIIVSEQAGLRAHCIGDTVAALGAVAETLLPRLARAGFATLVAETAQTIARRGRWPELLLTVAPDAAAQINNALDTFGSAPGVKVTIDPALNPGEVQLAWSQGGAEIDVEAIAEAALERFRLQLDGCAQQGAN